MTLSPNGILFVGTRKKGTVYAVLDNDQDQKADQVVTIASDLFMPNGVAFRDGHLYVAEVNRIIRFNDIEQNLQRPTQPVDLLVMPDGALLISDDYRGAIYRVSYSD